MIELSAKGSNGLLAKRYASEKRFRAYGAIALALTILFLGFLLFDIVSKGWPAFFESHTTLEIKVDPSKVSADDVANGDFAGMIKQTVREAGIRPDLPEAERIKLYSGHSLRAGLASSAEVDERYVQKQLGHASAEMTRRYQRRRDRFRVNLTKAVGL